MIDNNASKKRIFYMIILILTLITMIVSMALAYYSFVGSQKEDSTVLYTGTLKINYIDGVFIKDPILHPLKSVNYNSKDSVYRNSFQVTSTGTLDQTIDINLIVTKNEFYHNELKYALYNSNGTRLATGYVPESGKVNLVSNTFLPNNSETTYSLIIWWNNGEYQLKTEMGSVISGRIEVEAKQIKY